MVKSELSKLGFSQEEANVYTVLLGIGGGGASSIAKKAGSHRVTTYNTLENLEKKGFLRKTKKNGVLFYMPVDPQVILDRAEGDYRVAKGLIPELVKLQGKHRFKPNVRFLEGKSRVGEIFDDMLECKGEIVGFVNFKYVSELYPDFLENYNKEALKKGKNHRFLCPNDEFHEKYFENNLIDLAENDLLKIFAVDPVKFVFKNAQYIYDNKVSMLSFDRNEMMGVIIESSNNAETNRAIFDLAWLGATSFVAK
ncbi:MAG: helix-turn-helix domain-containing protein [Nitrospirota bacterium]